MQKTAIQAGNKPLGTTHRHIVNKTDVPGQYVVKIEPPETTAEPLPATSTSEAQVHKPTTVVAAATASGMNSPTLVKVASAVTRVSGTNITVGSPLRQIPGTTTKIITIGPSNSGIKYTPVTFSIAGTGVNGKKVVFTPTADDPAKKKPRIETVSLRTLSVGPSTSRPVVKMEIPSLPSTSSGNTETNGAKRRRRTTEDGVKGLRYFATKVCDKVREKNLTTYNSVAEDLVVEYSDPNPTGKSKEEVACEQKNIRRRVYDALNVLMAINVIQKERKQIRWVGLPRTLSEAGLAKRDHPVDRKKSLSHLRQRLFHSALQLIALKELATYNKKRAIEAAAERDAEKIAESFSTSKFNLDQSSLSMASELEDMESMQHIEMPFLFLTSGRKCEVECSVSGDAKEYELRFSQPFKIIEDTEILRNMPLVKALDKGQFDMEQVQKAVKQLPPFMQVRFVNLLTEHQERLRKAEENRKQEALIKAAALAERERQRQERLLAESVVASKTPIAPAPLKEEAMEEDFSGITPTPVAPIADLESGSPITLKPGYYIQISQMGVAQMTPLQPQSAPS